jgi:hypothetical protein
MCLSPWGRVLEKLRVIQLGKKFPATHSIRKFITVFTRALLWSLTWARWIHSAYRFTSCTLDKDVIHEEIKSRLNSWNACYHPGQYLLCFCLLSRDVKIKYRPHRSVTLTVVLYGYETWSLTLREEYRLRVCANRVLSIIFGPTRKRGTWRRRKINYEVS